MTKDSDSQVADIDKDLFEDESLSLRAQLLQAQFALVGGQRQVIVIIDGLEGAGKGSLVHRLNEWLDPRGIETDAFWQISDEERCHPHFWRFWRALPPRGSMALFIGGWYTQPTYDRIEQRIDEQQLQYRCDQILQLEQMLHHDGAIILKLWLQVGEAHQRMQLAEEAPRKLQDPRVPQLLDHERYDHDRQQLISSDLRRRTNTAECPWHVIDGERRNLRDLAVGRLLLQALKRAAPVPHSPELAPVSGGRLAGVDLDLSLSRSDYKRELIEWQARLQDLAWDAHRSERATVAVFEGWDAAGKGSAIRRVTGAIDPRLYKLVQFAAPTDEEAAQHYLWRFWRRLQQDGRVTLFDRSWYGRVLVERVEGYASSAEWRRAYEEINVFERQLADHGITVLKFWIHISPEEQLRRFEEREREPHKRHKMTAEDWRNREKWPLYAAAVEDMIGRTDTGWAPWSVIPGDDKRYARIEILKHCCRALDRSLS